MHYRTSRHVLGAELQGAGRQRLAVSRGDPAQQIGRVAQRDAALKGGFVVLKGGSESRTFRLCPLERE